ncbi:MAG TPA: hypothetical protein VES02_10490 [Dermatophilaceae bacterium]|nr:hypothetical protein [Dermatophilaceae bacterium]
MILLRSLPAAPPWAERTVRGTIPATASAAACATAGSTLVYVSAVIANELWPSCSDTTFISTPAWRARLAAV